MTIPEKQYAGLLKRNLLLEASLAEVLDHYLSLIDSGDCGSWDARAEPIMANAIKLLKDNHDNV